LVPAIRRLIDSANPDSARTNEPSRKVSLRNASNGLGEAEPFPKREWIGMDLGGIGAPGRTNFELFAADAG